MKNPSAVYRVGQHLVPVFPEDLSDGKKRNDLWDRVLTDPNELYQLFFRKKPNSETSYLFYRRSVKEEPRQFFQRGETDPNHKLRIRELLVQVSDPDIKYIDVVTYYFLPGGERKVERLAHLNCADYVWQAEARRIVSRECLVVHDLFGMPIRPDMSPLRPQIAIEVICSHLPQDKSLQGMIAMSDSIPLIILFHIYDTRKAYFEATKKEDTLVIRSTLFIMEGSVFTNDKALSCNTEESLKAQVKKRFNGMRT